MNVLVVHNSYQQPGGEDQVFEMEAKLLESHGHRVVRFHTHNDQVKGLSAAGLFATTIWNNQAYREIKRVLRENDVDIMHVHNTFPLISPAAYYAASRERVPVVQTLHNYRLFCPAATFYRDGSVCESCLGKAVTWPAVIHSCYRGSKPATVASTALIAIHRAAGTWKTKVSAYIALTDFARQKFIEGGLPAARIHVKPNFLDHDPGMASGKGRFALFAGRLTEDKGILTLIKAWERPGASMPLEIAGDGPLAPQVSEAARRNPNIRWHGWITRDHLLEKLRTAGTLVVPSEWHEPFGLTIVEAFASGIPVVASRLGSIASMLEHRRTGLLFQPGDAADLATQVGWYADHPAEIEDMRRRARIEYERKYTSEGNYRQLMAIYNKAIRQDGLNRRETPAVCPARQEELDKSFSEVSPFN
ncbi:MAG: glycosyltransferase family 4 protein [Bryobacteraceae bacterium]